VSILHWFCVWVSRSRGWEQDLVCFCIQVHTFYFQASQKFLCGGGFPAWNILAWAVLSHVWGLQYDQQLLTLISKDLFQDYSELPVFHQNHFRPWKLLRMIGSSLLIERMGGNLGENLLLNPHLCLQAWRPPYHAICWFWQVAPGLQNLWTVFSGGSPCCLSSPPMASPSAAEVEGCLTSWNLLSQAGPPGLAFLGRAQLGVIYHLLGHLQGSVSVRRAALLGISFQFIFQPPNPVNYLIYCSSTTVELSGFARMRLIPNDKWRKMWKTGTDSRC